MTIMIKAALPLVLLWMIEPLFADKGCGSLIRVLSDDIRRRARIESLGEQDLRPDGTLGSPSIHVLYADRRRRDRITFHSFRPPQRLQSLPTDSDAFVIINSYAHSKRMLEYLNSLGVKSKEIRLYFSADLHSPAVAGPGRVYLSLRRKWKGLLLNQTVIAHELVHAAMPPEHHNQTLMNGIFHEGFADFFAYAATGYKITGSLLQHKTAANGPKMWRDIAKKTKRSDFWIKLKQKQVVHLGNARKVYVGFPYLGGSYLANALFRMRKGLSKDREKFDRAAYQAMHSLLDRETHPLADCISVLQQHLVPIIGNQVFERAITDFHEFLVDFQPLLSTWNEPLPRI